MADRLRDARNVRVVLHANVGAIKLRDGGERVQALTVRTLRGRRLQVRPLSSCSLPAGSR